MTSPKQVLLNTLEQILSADHTRIGALAGKAAMDIAFFLASGQLAVPRSVVLRGLNATAGAGLSIDIATGEVAFYNAAAGVDSSLYQLGQNASVTNVLIAAADPANPRVDLIHATPTSTDTDPQVRNVLTLPSRVVTPTLVNKTRSPTMTLAATTGVPAASPVAPAIPAGAVPLWYVFVPAAFAGPFTDTELADGRQQFNPTEVMKTHGRVEGLFPVPVGLTTNITFQTGSGVMDGALGQLSANLTLDANDIFSAAGGGPVAGSTEYHLYSVIKGRVNHPVAKTLDMVFGIRTDPPDPDGRPSGAFYTYRPFQGIHDEWIHTVVGPQALYLGSVLSTAAAVWQIGGDSLALNRDGTTKEAVYTGTTPGLAGGVNGFTRPPQLTWIDANNVRLEESGPLLTGVPGFHFALTGNMPANLATNDPAEQNSTWYYVYLRNIIAGTVPVAGGVVRNYTLVISEEPPSVRLQKPTPEAGFTVQDYLYVGSFYNNAAGNIEQFQKDGNHVLLVDSNVTAAPWLLFSGAPATSPARSTVTANLPATARVAIIEVQGSVLTNLAATITQLYWQLFWGVATTNPRNHLRFDLGATAVGAGETWRMMLADEIQMPVDSLHRFEAMTLLAVNAGGGHDLIIHQVGYIEDVERRPLHA